MRGRCKHVVRWAFAGACFCCQGGAIFIGDAAVKITGSATAITNAVNNASVRTARTARASTRAGAPFHAVYTARGVGASAHSRYGLSPNHARACTTFCTPWPISCCYLDPGQPTSVRPVPRQDGKGAALYVTARAQKLLIRTTVFSPVVGANTVFIEACDPASLKAGLSDSIIIILVTLSCLVLVSWVRE